MFGPTLAGTRPHTDDELQAPLGRDVEAACVTGDETARWRTPPGDTPEGSEPASSRTGQHWGHGANTQGQPGAQARQRFSCRSIDRPGASAAMRATNRDTRPQGH